jgi:molybdate transport system substrate-binding protein
MSCRYIRHPRGSGGRWLRLAVVLLALSAAIPAHAADVAVFAAASLTDALNEIAQTFTDRTGKRVAASYAASSALAKQIEQGAPADLFASADTRWMDWLAERRLIASGTRVDLLGNSLVLVAPRDSPIARVEITPATDIAALAGGGRIATGNPDSVPVGVYFRQAMERAGQWRVVAPKVAGADSVRAALAFVERGEAALGVVYATDAMASAKVTVIGAFPAAMHDPIVYPFALVAGRDNPAAKAFLDFLATAEVRETFVRHGFRIR